MGGILCLIKRRSLGGKLDYFIEVYSQRQISRYYRELLHPAKQSTTKLTIRTYINRQIIFYECESDQKLRKVAKNSTGITISSCLCINTGCLCVSHMHQVTRCNLVDCNKKEVRASDLIIPSSLRI